VSGLVPIDEETWAIYGSIPVDGQVIVAEFDDRAVAESTLERIVAAEPEMQPAIRHAGPSGLRRNRPPAAHYGDHHAIATAPYRVVARPKALAG